MKYVVILGDGMADQPLKELGDKTPLQFAHKPSMDYLAQHGRMGLVNTVPENMAPGSDIANLSVLGYAPEKYYTGRSPLEALNIGIDLKSSDVALRCNFVTLSIEEPYFEKTILDYCSDEISTEEANILIQTLNQELGSDDFCFYTGTSYRNCLVWENGLSNLGLTPPHNITGKKITPHFPSHSDSKKLLWLMEKSFAILKDHPINIKRQSQGLKPANSIWLWGEGKKPTLSLFKDLYQVNGSMISAVDLLNGIARCAGLKVVSVEGATGNIHTNFLGKAKAALTELQSGQDFVFIHIEAPDECGHRGELDNKVKSIELIDKEVLSFLLKELNSFDDFKILLLPDHPTPIALRTHTSDPVPFIIYQKSRQNLETADTNARTYDEVSAAKTQDYISVGSDLMKIFLST